MSNILKFRIPIKFIGYVLSAFGLLILAEPYISIGFLSDAFISKSWKVNSFGMAALSVGAVMISGMPSKNKLFDIVESGLPFLMFTVGFSLLYINTWGTDMFVTNLATYTLFGLATATVFVAVRRIFGIDELG